MPLPSPMQQILSREISTPLTKGASVGDIHANTGPARIIKQRIQPFIGSGIPGVRKGRKVSLKSLMAPVRTSYVSGSGVKEK